MLLPVGEAELLAHKLGGGVDGAPGLLGMEGVFLVNLDVSGTPVNAVGAGEKKVLDFLLFGLGKEVEILVSLSCPVCGRVFNSASTLSASMPGTSHSHRSSFTWFRQ